MTCIHGTPLPQPCSSCEHATDRLFHRATTVRQIRVIWDDAKAPDVSDVLRESGDAAAIREGEPAGFRRLRVAADPYIPEDA